MKAVFVFTVVASLFTGNVGLPVGKERQREDVITRCLVEVLSKALSKPDSLPLDQECKDIVKAGSKHAPLENKSNGEEVTHEEETPSAQEADVKDIEALLKSVDEKRETPEEERSQESWGLDEEEDKTHGGEEEQGGKEKRIWRPTHRYHHKIRNHKRDEEGAEEEREEPDESRSQESWGLDDDKEREEDGGVEKRSFRRERVYMRKHKRSDDESRSQESWGLDDDKRSEQEEDGGVEKRSWRAGRVYQKKHRRSDDPTEEDLEEDASERDKQEAIRYLAEKQSEMERNLLGEGEVLKRSPWAYRGYYHPAWWKRTTETHAAPSHKEEQDNLAVMDAELQQIAEKMHANRDG